MPVRVACLAAVFLMVACGPPRRTSEGGGDSCKKECGSTCCGAAQSCDPTSNTCVACEPKTCQQSGATCGSVGDGCGGTLECGGCGANETCTGNVCVPGGCVPRTCDSIPAGCGEFGDGCGGTLECGTCQAGETCGAGGPYQCGTGACQAESDLAFCQRLSLDCGAVTTFDNCGNSRAVISCGECSGADECVENVCRCIPGSDASLCEAQDLCGTATATDRCGVTRTVTCDPCPVPTGGACTDSGQCVGEFCITEDGYPEAAFPGGYCSGLCEGPDDCDEGATCTRVAQQLTLCLQDCVNDGSCRPGYECVANACLPITPPAQLNEHCGFLVGRCPDDALCVTRYEGAAVGLCVPACDGGTCGAGQECIQESFCLTDCSSGQVCPGVGVCAEGYCFASES